jgi:hypothetical protein
MHTVCFNYLCEQAEDLAGPVILVDAGRRRGSDIATTQGMQNTTLDLDTYQATLDDILGEQGTCLCIVQSISKRDNAYVVQVAECANEKYTLGVFIGLLSEMTGTTLLGKTETTNEEGDHTFVLSEI